MIKPEVFNYDKPELINWLRHEAGSSNPDYFHAVKSGGLKLQQVPEEFADLLIFLQNRNIKKYLALGIGNGGSFITECFFMKNTLTHGVAVDSLAYGKQIGQNVEEVIKFIQSIDPNEDNLCFCPETTDSFFLGGYRNLPRRYDAIFIDADHSYEGARRDYDNALKHINKGGIIIFHDINSEACPGIKKLWSEVKADRIFHEFVASKTCGIGIIEI